MSELFSYPEMMLNQHRRLTALERPITRLAAISLLAFAIALVGPIPHGPKDSGTLANASSGDGIIAYVSPPFVQGPPSSVNPTIETFDVADACNLTTLNARTPSVGTFSGSCSISNGASVVWGGATTTSDEPTVGGDPRVGTPSFFPSAPSSGALTVTFASPQKYVGFWWSAGSAGNTVRFYGTTNNLLATFTTTTINSILGASPPSPYPGSVDLTALNGTHYKAGYYFGRPYAHTSLTPTSLTSQSTNGNNETHAYLSLFASGSISFGKVEFSGTGFEFDNLAISADPGTPPTGLVFVESVLGKSVTFQANGGSGSMDTQTSSAARNLSANTFTRTGYTFTRWHTRASGTGGTSYDDEESYGFGADLTLYAQWTANTYNVTYDEQGGTTVTDDTYTTGSTITLPTAPTRAGHTFTGWFTTPTGGTALGATYSPPGTGDITLYAQWTTPRPASAATTTTTQPPSPTASRTPELLAPERARAGTRITVTATGFTPGENVRISIPGINKVKDLTADSTGTVALTVRIERANGPKTLVARASAGTRVASSTITVIAQPLTLPTTGWPLNLALNGWILILLGVMAVRMRKGLG